MTRIKLATIAVALAALTSAAAAGGDTHSQPAYPIRPEISTRTRVRSQLAARRQLQIQRLAAYSARGVFPRNTTATGLLNVFVDEAGNLCAAANLISLSGGRDLVTKTARANNFIRLVEVTEGPLLDWMLTSGLTVDEIDRIQEPYMGMPANAEPAVIAAETRRLQRHFARVLAELARNRDASLDAATSRAMKRPDLIAALLKR